MSGIIEPGQRHKCSPPRSRGPHRVATNPAHQLKLGSVWQCEDCKKWWTTIPKPQPQYGYSPRGVMWVPVAWYHRKAKKLIRKAING